ncbi:hypothetical protein RYH80_19390 [Halobaculum sp. MBLA0147]|uniref:DUF7861 family protein n=1 Tax=Halobaculum sp. MBLA0147 TaxID=3079934 RepID=UPI003525599B
MNHDRIHAQPPKTDPETWRTGEITDITERDGHAVFTVAVTDATADSGDDGSTPETVELTVTYAVRDLVVSRVDGDAEDSPIGESVWFRPRGGG